MGCPSLYLFVEEKLVPFEVVDVYTGQKIKLK
jgi:hypothetical protein